jgi:hypothetical protein
VDRNGDGPHSVRARAHTYARASAPARAGTMNAKFITHYVSDQAGYPPPSLPPSRPISLKPPAPSAQPQPHPLVGRPQSALPPSLARLFVCACVCLRAAVRSSALGRSGDVAAGLRVALQRGPHLHARLLPRQVGTPVTAVGTYAASRPRPQARLRAVCNPHRPRPPPLIHRGIGPGGWRRSDSAEKGSGGG